MAAMKILSLLDDMSENKRSENMRLIDADTVEKYFYEHLDDLHMAAAMNAINEMPTVDAVEKTKLIKALKYGKGLLLLKSFTKTELKAINGVFNYIIEMLK